jgi:hypothetical protein
MIGGRDKKDKGIERGNKRVRNNIFQLGITAERDNKESDNR